MTSANLLPDVVITADTHVGEPEALRERLPERFRARLPELTVNTDGNLVFKVNGKVVYGPPERKPTAEDLLREFRSDPSQGTSLERRLHDMAIEGVDGQVIFPNIGLCCSMGDEDVEYYQATEHWMVTTWPTKPSFALGANPSPFANWPRSLARPTT